MTGGQDHEQEQAEKAQKCFSELKCYKKYKYLFLQSAFIYIYKQYNCIINGYTKLFNALIR